MTMLDNPDKTILEPATGRKVKHPLGTTAGLQRALKPGTPVRLVNHVRPAGNRTTTVHARTNSRVLATYGHTNRGDVQPMCLDWPKAALIDPDPEFGNIVTIRTENGAASLSIVILSSADDVPAEYRADTEAAA
jgi:hypothetical protein